MLPGVVFRKTGAYKCHLWNYSTNGHEVIWQRLHEVDTHCPILCSLGPLECAPQTDISPCSCVCTAKPYDMPGIIYHSSPRLMHWIWNIVLDGGPVATTETGKEHNPPRVSGPAEAETWTVVIWGY